MTISTRIRTALFGTLVGTDSLNNRYYEEKRPRQDRKSKRWVRYHNQGFLTEFFGRLPDASRVSPEWHGWLHHTAELPPTRQSRAHYGWEKPPQSNLTGTQAAYLPPGHLARGARHAPTTAEYEPWRP